MGVPAWHGAWDPATGTTGHQMGSRSRDVSEQTQGLLPVLSEGHTFWPGAHLVASVWHTCSLQVQAGHPRWPSPLAVPTLIQKPDVAVSRVSASVLGD